MPTEMTNQAAQTMPSNIVERLASAKDKLPAGSDERMAVWHAIEYFRALPQTAVVAEGWLRVCDEEMVGAHIGVADASDDYATAKKKLHDLITWHIQVATDPAVNGGFVLIPREPTPEMWKAGKSASVEAEAVYMQDRPQSVWDKFGFRKNRVKHIYNAMLAAAPAASGGESAASVSERARELRERAEAHGGGVFVSVGDIRALEQALTQQRGVEDAWPLAMRVREALDRESCPDHFMRVAVETITGTTPQPSADAVRELVEALQVAELALRERGLRACGEYKQIAAAIAKATNHQQNAAQGGGV